MKGADQKQRHAACRGVAQGIRSDKASFAAFAEKCASSEEFIAALGEAREHVLATGKLDAKGRKLFKECTRFITRAGAFVPWSEHERVPAVPRAPRLLREHWSLTDASADSPQVPPRSRRSTPIDAALAVQVAF